jgi:CheY-like chemotaxis protein
MNKLAAQFESQTSWFRRLIAWTFDNQVEAKEFATPAPAPPEKPAKNQNILLLDDDPIFLKLATNTLRREGYEVFPARDGSEALAIARTHRLDGMVLDVMLAREFGGVAWNGFNIMSWLDRFDGCRNLPVVMTSVGDPSQNTREAIRAGATAFFYKRFKQSDLAEIVAQSLEQPRVNRIAAETASR